MNKTEIQKLNQKDNHTFTIHWADGNVSDYNLGDLQSQCPCANCLDAITGLPKTSQKVQKDVRAVKLRSIGKYAIQIAFTSGCSHGIYGFDFLRKLKGLAI